MKKYLVLLVALLFACSSEPDKVLEVKLMYNHDIGYSWYLENPKSLQMVELQTETKTPGAFETTTLGNPYTQTFTFRLKNDDIESETVVFKYKHYLEKDEPHSEGTKTFDLKAADFK